jgi:phosphoglycerate dehydrogenase-like enzyme
MCRATCRNGTLGRVTADAAPASEIPSEKTTGNLWNLLLLAPLDEPTAGAIFDGLPVRITAPPAPYSLPEVLADAEIVLGDWRTAHAGLDATAVAAAPRLAFVQQPSVGVQAHDPTALAEAGIPLSNVAGFNSIAVAEWVIGALFSVARQLVWSQAELLAGRWPQTEVVEHGATEIAGRRIGLVGFGSIGQALVPRFTALGCEVAYWSRRRRNPHETLGATYRELDELIATSDVLVNVVALTPETRGLLSRDRLALLPRGAFLVNASRGGIVDEDAVAAALRDGQLAGAAFDVYAIEPLPADSSLREAPNILLTPHTGGSTAQTIPRLIEGVVANIRRAVSGKPVHDVVNGVDPLVRRRIR